jgi:AraC-like DNA-binding protein/CheY-like chemotaxis protein
VNRFIQIATGTKIPVADTEAILLDVLTVLNARVRLPYLLDDYLATRRLSPDPVNRFHSHVRRLLLGMAIGNKQTENSIAILETRYADSTLTQARVAELVGLSSSELANRFRRHVGSTFTERLRKLRLDSAATLLARTNHRVKEVWAQVGYNDGSNFDHQFKERFGVSPTEYRRRSIIPDGNPPDSAKTPRLVAVDGSGEHRKVLIVEDHDNTRETVGRYLKSVGFEVELVARGDQALEAANRLGVCAIILDYHLPDMDGLSWMRALPPQVRAQARVILFTADFDVAEQRPEIERLGAVYMPKLCDIDEIVSLIGGPPQRTPFASAK